MKSRNQFLNTVSESNRLNAAVNVWVSVLCGMPDTTSLPPRLQTLSILPHKVAPTTETLRFPRAAFVMDKALHSGFLCCIAESSNGCVLSRYNFFV